MTFTNFCKVVLQFAALAYATLIILVNNNNNNNNNAIGGLGGRHKKITINGHFRKWSISSECVTILFSP